MSKRLARAAGALAAAAAMTAGAVMTAAPAGANSTDISRPTLTAVCSQPHNGPSYTTVRFRQHGHWAAGARVVVTLATGNSDRPKVEMHKRTDADGSFRIHRRLHSENTGPWIVGRSYSWTTAMYKRTAATARRGTVTLTSNC